MKTISACIVPVSLTLCAALVIGALTWITRGTLAAERERAQADARADLQERTRLALWRMDSLGAALLLDESSHPDVESRLPVKLRFTVSPKGKVSVVGEQKESPDELLHKTIGTGSRALQCVSSITMTPAPVAPNTELSQTDEPMKSRAGYDRLDIKSQAAANWGEQAVRNKAVQSYLWNSNVGRSRAGNAPAPSAPALEGMPKDSVDPDTVGGQTALASVADRQTAFSEESGSQQRDESHDARNLQVLPAQEISPPPADGIPQSQGWTPFADFATRTVAGQPRVAWVDGLLLLARRVGNADNNSVFDGAWIDQQALSSLLLAEVRDLFTTASLVPSQKAGTDGMVLASFPFRLEVPPPGPASIRPRESTVISLAMSWAAALIALTATMWLVRGVMRLSERRASFVSAVTHELRTPLTTFRLYSDMLESGAVKEERRSEYLRVLTREADRLTHLVENVLAFSRIERGNARSKVRDVDADELLENMRERLEARLEAVGLHLALDIPPGLRVRADQAAVEHILFNLIDNAAKYAATSDPPVITISATRKRCSVCLRIRDHGPGVRPAEARRIFRPFHKSAHEAAETKPGVGLGLALSRRLAQEQCGELTCKPTENGACFELCLPAVGTI